MATDITMPVNYGIIAYGYVVFYDRIGSDRHIFAQ